MEPNTENTRRDRSALSKLIPEEASDRKLDRAPPREESPRERAAKRAAELRGHLGNDANEGPDDFYIPPSYIPDGWSYEWKRKFNVGQEDTSHQLQVAVRGWQAVPTSRHPSLMPEGTKYQSIERKGMILMERPLEITEDSMAHEYNKARAQIRQKEAQLASAPDGTMTRDHAQVKPKISKGYEPIPVPKD